MWSQEGLREIAFLCDRGRARLPGSGSPEADGFCTGHRHTLGPAGHPRRGGASEGNLFSLQPGDELNPTCSCTESLGASQAVLKLPPFPSC